MRSSHCPFDGTCPATTGLGIAAGSHPTGGLGTRHGGAFDLGIAVGDGATSGGGCSLRCDGLLHAPGSLEGAIGGATASRIQVSCLYPGSRVPGLRRSY